MTRSNHPMPARALRQIAQFPQNRAQLASSNHPMPARALRPFDFDTRIDGQEMFESPNARQGIKTKGCCGCHKLCYLFESPNARQGIKT